MLHITVTIAGTLYMVGISLYAQRENAETEAAYLASRHSRTARRAALRRTYEHDIAALAPQSLTVPLKPERATL